MSIISDSESDVNGTGSHHFGSAILMLVAGFSNLISLIGLHSLVLSSEDIVKVSAMDLSVKGRLTVVTLFHVSESDFLSLDEEESQCYSEHDCDEDGSSNAKKHNIDLSFVFGFLSLTILSNGSNSHASSVGGDSILLNSVVPLEGRSLLGLGSCGAVGSLRAGKSSRSRSLNLRNIYVLTTGVSTEDRGTQVDISSP